MRFQRCTLMALTLLAMVLVAHMVVAETRRGRQRRGRSPHVALLAKLSGLQTHKQKGKCPTYKSDKYFPVRINTAVPEPELRGDIKTRSLCPWTYRIDIDNQRYPSHISQAVCAGHSRGFDLNPVEIKQQILVLRKEQSGCTFTLETMTVVVGCTCVTSDS